MSETVIEAVADAVGTDPLNLTPPLYEAIDPDALDQLFAGTPPVGKVVFNYNGCEVSVFPDGYVSVETREV